ncbi:hypothetical protein OG339_43500 [Streptosporangium sp. NBC_01495]
MRYSDRSGGLSGTERERREALRLQAADMFSGGISPPRVAHLLGVTRKSACEWHRAWLKGDKTALVSKGAAGTGCKLTQEQLARLETLLDEGAIAHGWDDQRWTSACVAALITERFHIRIRGVPDLLGDHRVQPGHPRHALGQAGLGQLAAGGVHHLHIVMRLGPVISDEQSHQLSLRRKRSLAAASGRTISDLIKQWSWPGLVDT